MIVALPGVFSLFFFLHGARGALQTLIVILPGYPFTVFFFQVFKVGLKSKSRKIIRIVHRCEVRIDKSLRVSLFDITRLRRVMPKVIPRDGFLSASNNHGTW